jgi:hypothetical protein
MASFSIRVSMFSFARCCWFCLLDPSFPLFSCDLKPDTPARLLALFAVLCIWLGAQNFAKPF